ncbi:hypothetical protein FRB98_001035 [Tulasnella sp. 332]|nr:hypothetical protein FRB98_001035 [Tulasnella sp. 332]
MGPDDVERGYVRPIAHDQYTESTDVTADPEEQALLPAPPGYAIASQAADIEPRSDEKAGSRPPQTQGRKWTKCLPYVATFAAGIATCLAAQRLSHSSHSDTQSQTSIPQPNILADSVSGSSVFHFPPSKPTNWQPSLFPTNVGYTGPTPTGNEPGLIATAPAYPVHTGAPQLVGPSSLGGVKGDKVGSFDIFKHWGNLRHIFLNFTEKSDNFGLPGASPEAPEGCTITGLHFLHRHGARYPTSSREGPEQVRYLLEKAKKDGVKWRATGDLSFLNTWDFPLGNELLTPFGRQQMYDLGVTLRIKYGFLLQNFTDTLPVFRTESQDRMLHSAMNFAVGFFGYPIEGKYLQSITYEAWGVNNTLAPYMTCPNSGAAGKADRHKPYVSEWISVYLKDAAARLQGQLKGLEITERDAYNFQELCAYETVALGYSKFCELFTEEEWKGFNYALDLFFWYGHSFGSPVARVQGIGYIQELVARLTHTPIQTHNSSTNATLNDNPITFPLHQPLYVDATHEVVVLNIITALGLNTFAKTGPLPSDHIPENRSFYASRLAPFGTNMQFQLLSCAATPDPQIRIIINDGVTPLTGIPGCPASRDGLCSVESFVNAQKQTISDTDWNWDCHGDWTVPAGTGWNTTSGTPPPKDAGRVRR